MKQTLNLVRYKELLKKEKILNLENKSLLIEDYLLKINRNS